MAELLDHIVPQSCNGHIDQALRHIDDIENGSTSDRIQFLQNVISCK